MQASIQEGKNSFKIKCSRKVKRDFLKRKTGNQRNGIKSNLGNESKKKTQEKSVSFEGYFLPYPSILFLSSLVLSSSK